MPDRPTSTGATPNRLHARLRALADELETYRRRYGQITEPVELTRMEQAIGRRVSRMDALRVQMAELLGQISRLDEEIAGLSTGYAALLEHILDRVRLDEGEGWSPTPVLGYRLWAWRAGGVHGARETWSSPTKTATCTAGDDEVPHSDGRCGRLGCGIYAAKELGTLLDEHTTPDSYGFLAGRVELWGKVVEHERGYRAARATVVAAVLVGEGRVVTTDDPTDLAAIFDRPDEVMQRRGRRSDVPRDSVAQLVIPDDRSASWTSETSSE